jgi:hypothetical protein
VISADSFSLPKSVLRVYRLKDNINLFKGRQIIYLFTNLQVDERMVSDEIGYIVNYYFCLFYYQRAKQNTTVKKTNILTFDFDQRVMHTNFDILFFIYFMIYNTKMIKCSD